MLEAKQIRRCALAYLFFVFCLLDFSTAVSAQTYEQVQQILFYNCENLFDSSDDPDRQDDDYTPEGLHHWTSYRQYQKLLNISKVIVAAGRGKAPSLIGLAEVENDSVMHRLTKGTPLYDWGYEYIITRSDDARGINVALMYQPMDFRLLGWNGVKVAVPYGSRPTRDLLHAWGRVVGGDTLDIIVCHLPSRLSGKQSEVNRRSAHQVLRHTCDSVLRVRRHPHLLVMGDMNDYPNTPQLRREMHFGDGLENLMDSIQTQMKRGQRPYGTHKYQGKWGILDQFWTNGSMCSDGVSADSLSCSIWVDQVDIVAFPFMLTEDDTHLGHRPMRSFHGYKYEGGFSDHLPIRLSLHIRYR